MQQSSAINPAFVQLLNHHFLRFQANEFDWMPSAMQHNARLNAFTECVNRHLPNSRFYSAHGVQKTAPVSAEMLQQMLDGNIAPTPVILDSLLATLGLYGEENVAFKRLGERVIEDEKERYRQAWLQSPQGQDETIKEQEKGEQQMAYEQAKALFHSHARQWRQNNPQGLPENTRSFQEMLEISNEKHEDFRAFLFERVLPSWGDMSYVGFCNHLEHLNSQNDTTGKDTITSTVLTQWQRGDYKPLRESVDVICRAFGIAPQDGELMARHERLLWKAIGGHEFRWSDKKGMVAIEQAIRDTKETGDRGALVAELFHSCGIGFERLTEILNIKQLAMWMKGQKIENMDNALAFLELTNPQPSEAANGKISAQNKEMLSLITGREFNLDTIIEQSSHKGYPGGSMFLALTGRQGLVTITPQDIIDYMQTAEINCNEDRLKKMRTGNKLQRGGKIYEQEARAILTLVNHHMQPLIEKGICEPMSNKQLGQCMETLTGIEHPKKMLKKVVEGEMNIQDMVRKTCARRNLIHTGQGSFCEQVGISNISSFLCGKSHLDKYSATKLATWYEEEYQFTEEEQKQLMMLARGIDIKRTPQVIMQEVEDGTLNRSEGLRQIYNYSTLSHPMLAEAANSSEYVITYSTGARSGAIIAAGDAEVKRIGEQCSITSEEDLKKFVKLFGHKHNRRKDVLTNHRKVDDSSWQEHVQDNHHDTNGWGRGLNRADESA